MVSVRPTAHEWVPPDSVTLHTTATAVAGTPEQARVTAGQVVGALTEDFAGRAHPHRLT